MNCSEAELLLVTVPEAELPPEVSEHLSGCAQCRAFAESQAQLLAAASLPPPSPEEKAALATLAPRLHQSWRQRERRRSTARRFIGLALAACFGAAVASAALLPRVTAVPPLVAGEVLPAEFSFSPESELAPSDTEDELDTFEVSWPSPQ